MSGTMYLYLLIVCGIWSQGIIGTYADEEINESSDFLIRQKRVVSYEQGGASVVRIEERPYVVHIKKSGRIFCMGTILSHRAVITTIECAELPATQYKIVSKSSTTSYIGALHNVTTIIERKGNIIPGRYQDGIALMFFTPEIVYGTFVKNIELHVGPLLPGMTGSVSGWGYNCRNKVTGPGTNYPSHLRSIEVPIISHQDCINIYRNYYPITDKDICTFHPQRHCGHTDRGAPFVIDNALVGIFLRSGPVVAPMNREYPEVYALLQHNHYSEWIRANI